MRCSLTLHTGRLALTAVLIGAAIPALAYGQASAEAADAKLQADCRLAGQLLATGRSAPLWGWAVEFINRCDQTAGDALAAAWRSRAADSATFEDLLRGSREIRDQRIYVAATAVARDVTASWWSRASALQLLVSYVAPELIFDPDYLRPRADSAVRIGTASHWVQSEGSQPLAADAVSQLNTLLALLAESDPDAALRHTAGVLHRSIRSR